MTQSYSTGILDEITDPRMDKMGLLNTWKHSEPWQTGHTYVTKLKSQTHRVEASGVDA